METQRAEQMGYEVSDSSFSEAIRRHSHLSVGGDIDFVVRLTVFRRHVVLLGAIAQVVRAQDDRDKYCV